MMNMVYPHNGIILSHKKEWSCDKCHSKDEPWKHYPKWKKPDIKGYIRYDYIYTTCPD